MTSAVQAQEDEDSAAADRNLAGCSSGILT